MITAGWGVRRLRHLLLAPAASIALIAASATIAPFAHLPWSWVPLALVTLIAASCAFAVGRRARDRVRPTSRPTWLAGVGAFITAALIITWQFARAFGAPENIAQRFDNIVHLNAIRLALDSADASPFEIGRTSDIGFYPNAWHALTTLTAQLSGADVPTAVNVANLAFVAVLWPASMMALSAVLFSGRTAALVASAALSTGFGAFPALFFNWGVLYPNAVGFATIPATLATLVTALRAAPGRDLLRSILLLGLMALGTALGHPNALLAATIFGSLLCAGLVVRDAVLAPSRSTWRRAIAVTVLGGAISLLFIALARTGAEHSGWQPWQTPAQAFGEGVLASPRGYAPTIIVAVLLLAGIISSVVRPRGIPYVLPFAAAVTLFVLASGFPVENRLRGFLTNPWYSDPNRFAALLAVTAVPVAVLGSLLITDAVRAALLRTQPPLSATAYRSLSAVAAIGATAIVFSVGTGPNVSSALSQVREAYTSTPEALLLSPDERALIDRLDQHLSPGDLIIGSPRTGVSLAYALAGFHVTERHIFGSPSEDDRFLDSHLRDIGVDPAVCQAVGRVGVDYVLDFGPRDVIDESGAAAYAGVIDLEPSEHLVLVDSQGPDARLFRVEGC